DIHIGGDYALGIAVDADGNAYVTGQAASMDFPTTLGAFQRTRGGAGVSAFVTKLNSAGTALVYSTYLGGSGPDLGYAIAVDCAGHAYVTGATASSDFPITPGAFQTSKRSVGDNAFVTELNVDGTGLIYSTYLGGSGTRSGDIGYGIALDADG